MKISQENNSIKITFRYDPRLVSLIKGIAGRRYSSVERCWYLPYESAAQALPQLLAQGFTITPEAQETLRGLAEEQRALLQLKQAQETEFSSTLPLFPYQRVGGAFLVRAGSCILGDDVGLGKTIQALSAIEKTGGARVLILCPAILKYQWQAEIKKFMPQETSVVIEGARASREELWRARVRFYVANYELLLKDLDIMSLQSWDYIVCDEATRIANIFTKTHKALQKLTARRRLALTGTPISNHPQELWGIVNWTNPGLLGNYREFLDRYCVRNMFGGIFGYRDLEQLQKRVAHVMIRRHKEEVLKELPPRIVSDVPFRLGEEEHALYQKIQQELLFDIEKQEINKVENPVTMQQTIVKLVRLRQLTDSMELLGTSTTSTKLAVLKELLKDVIGERKVIVFSQFARMCDILARELSEYNPVKITGEVSDSKRQEIIQEFNSDPRVRVLVSSSAGQYGLNIQAASIVIHYDQEFSLAKMKQRVGRAHRLGQKQSVLEYNLLAKGTVDFWCRSILHRKQEVSSAILGDKISLEDIKQLLTYVER